MNEISVDFLTILLPSYLFFYMAIRLYVRNRKSELNRLASFLMLSLLFYFLGEYTKKALFPPQWESHIVLMWNAPMLLIAISLLVHICLIVSGQISRRNKRFIPIIYASPLVLLAVLLAVYSPGALYRVEVKNGPSPLHPMLLALALFFVGVYMLSSVSILLISWFKSKEPRRKKLLLNLLLSILMLFVWLFVVTLLLQIGVLTSPSAMSCYFTGLFVWLLLMQRAISKYDFLPDFRKRFITLFQSAPTAIMMLDGEGGVREMNPSAKSMFNGLKNRTGVIDVAGHLYFEDGTCLTEQLGAYISAKKEGMGLALTLRIPFEQPADMMANLDRITDGDETLLVLHLIDVTVLKETERRLVESERNYRYLAHHDTLTGLCNRAYLQELVDQKVQDRERFALILIDLDDFKAINDRNGHLVGDSYLEHIAHVLKAHAQEGDILGRIGGDEFIVIFPMGKAPVLQAARDRLQALTIRPFIGYDLLIPISFSAGVALYPEHAPNLTELIRKADEAMYSVKRSGKNDLAVYTAEDILALTAREA
ncbi:diguanylate cyclase (GGDEF)-like protein [Paenibacillus phyllosphaerae]|uniref:Diguanylate cyclase (GGDEF)-like protein n=1 Tax=Paenibacillus phyllosphaerae TaxID=274593 RepID=A0A7W5B3R3_9BACL|nr:sensor domain-containing diguanylate cyclase [Paenibacillus phyllosphaerae]MBB3113880.1 diguanylate cyclase (GGDEF)-like protein [Paenibacillus phyllosphaerae]